MSKRLVFEIPINIGDVTDEDEIKSIASNAIEKHQSQFASFLANHIDRGDARTSLIDDSLRVVDIQIEGASGWAEFNFESAFYAGCKDLNSMGEHETSVEFRIVGGILFFDIEIPPAWIIQD